MQKRKDVVRVAVYARISKDDSGEGLNVDTQISDCRSHVAHMDTVVNRSTDIRWVVDERWVLRENDTSATKGVRPGFERLVTGIREGAFDVVVAWSLDRISRSMRDSALLLELIEETGVHLVTVDTKVNTTGDSGPAQLAMWSAMAQIEIANMRARLKRKAQQNRDAGRPTNGGSRCFAWEPDRKTIRPPEVAVIRDVAARIIGGSSLSSMVRYLNDMGVRTPGKLERDPTNGNAPTGRVIAQSTWNTVRLKSMLTLPRHAGLLTYKGDVLRDDDGTARRLEWYAPGPDGKPVRGDGDPILDVDTHNRLRAVVAGRTFTAEGWSNARQHALSGLVVCGVCEQPMFVTYANVREGRSPVWSFRCRGHASRARDLLERHVFDQVIERALDPAHRWLIESWESEDHEAIRSKADQKRADVTALEDEFIANGGSPARLARLTAALEAEIADLDEAMMRELAYRSGVQWAKFDLRATLAESASRLATDEPGATTKLDLMDRQRDCFSFYAKAVKVYPVKPGRGFDPAAVEIVWHEGQPVIASSVVPPDFAWHLAEGDTITVEPPPR